MSSIREIELAWLIEKLTRSERLIARAEAYYQEHEHLWSPEIAAYFKDILERKKDQVHYEEHRAEKLGWLIATGREAHKIDI